MIEPQAKQAHSDDALRRYTQRLEMLREIDQAILTGAPLATVGRITLRYLHRLIPYVRASILLFDYAERTMSILAAADEQLADCQTQQPHLSMDTLSLPDHLEPNQLENNVEVNTILSQAHNLLLGPIPHSRQAPIGIQIPLIVRNRLLGSLRLESYTWPVPIAEQNEIIHEATNQLTLAIQHSQLFTQAQRHATDMEQAVTRRTQQLTIMNEQLQHEIIERKRTEAALRERDVLLQGILRSLPEHIAVIARDGTIIAVNIAWCRFATDNGVESLDQVGVGVNYLDTCRNTEGPFANKASEAWNGIHAVLDGHLPQFTLEYSCATISGEKWFVMYVAPLNGEQGGAVISHVDISERKQAEQALARILARLEDVNQRLKRSHDTLQTLLEGLEDGLLLLDTTGQVLAINQALASIFNHTPAELIGKSWFQIYTGTSPAFPGEQALLTLEDGRARRQRERYSVASGKTYMFDMQTLPLSGTNQPVDQVILHIVDVTERIHLEALQIENERFAASGQLAATVAHEVNTPLQAIQTFLYLASHGTSEQCNQYLTLAGEEIDRISRIVQQLLEIQRPRKHIHRAVNLNKLIQWVLVLTNSTLAKHGIDVELKLQDDLPDLWGDTDLLTQVLLNLILNAVAAMPNGGKLSFTTYLRAGADLSSGATRVIMQISDIGCGIPPDVQPHIFDPFFTTKDNGSGLGLTVSRRIIAQHGGKISVQSELDAGTTFSIEFPLRDIDMAFADT